MSFDRHEILKKHYRAEIDAGTDWDALKQEASEYPDEDGDGDPIGRVYLGSVMSIMPSGKYYMPWCTNQSRSDETRDAAYWEALEEAAEEHGMWIDGGEGDPTDLFACCHIETATEEE